MRLELLTSQQVADLLNYSDRQIRRFAKDGDLPYIQVNERGKLLFSLHDLESWLERHRRPIPESVKIEKIKLIRR